jgi:cell division protein FtsL
MGKNQLTRLLQILAAVLIVVLVIGLYKAKTDASKTRAHVRELQTQVESSEADLRELRAEIAHLESPARVEELAKQHLHMTPGDQNPALPEGQMDQRLPAAQAPAHPQSAGGH